MNRQALVIKAAWAHNGQWIDWLASLQQHGKKKVDTYSIGTFPPELQTQLVADVKGRLRNCPNTRIFKHLQVQGNDVPIILYF